MDLAGNPEMGTELVGAGELLGVIGAAAGGAVREKDQRVFAFGVVAQGNKEAVVEMLVLGLVEREFAEVDVVLAEFRGAGGEEGNRDRNKQQDKRDKPRGAHDISKLT